MQIQTLTLYVCWWNCNVLYSKIKCNIYMWKYKKFDFNMENDLPHLNMDNDG